MNLGYYLRRYRNRRLNRKEFRERRVVLESYPYRAFIDVTNACLLSCPLCPTGNRGSSFPKGMMSFDTFKNIFDNIGPYLYELHLYNWGEPFLNRRLAEFIRYAKGLHNPKVILSTTLMGAERGSVEEVLVSGVDLISVSIDGATQEVYEKYRVGGRLDHVLPLLGHMAEVKRRSGMKRPVLRWQFIPMRHNESEIEAARSMALGMGVKFGIQRVRLNSGVFDRVRLEDAVEKNRQWLPENREYIRYAKSSGKKSVCEYLWEYVVFNWDGSVVPCCRISDPKDIFAHAFKGEFMEVWNGPYYTKAREIFNGRNAEEDFVCQRCYDHSGLE